MKVKKKGIIYLISFNILFFSAVFISSYVIKDTKYNDFFSAKVCTKYSKVQQINFFQYRSGSVTLENGSIVELNQPRQKITIGSEICVKYGLKDNK